MTSSPLLSLSLSLLLKILARRSAAIAVSAVLLAACDNKDPLDSATGPSPTGPSPTGSSPTGSPTSDSEGMTEGTGTDTDAPTTGAPTTGAPTTGTSESTTTGEPLSHAVDIQPIWDDNCVDGCHTPSGTGATWFILSDGAAYDALVEKSSISFPALTLITPGDRDASYLWHKVNGTHFDVGGGGTRMPQPPANPLADADIDTIARWIDEGCAP